MDEVDYRRKISQGGPRLAKNLTLYISYLIKNSHFTEAKFYHQQLHSIKPNHKESILLGYKIATNMLDIDSVILFDELLRNSNAKPFEAYRAQLYFACSFGQADLCRRILNQFLMLPQIEDEDITLIINAMLLFGEYEHLSLLSQYLRKKHLALNDATSKTFKPIALKKLVDIISEVRLA